MSEGRDSQEEATHTSTGANTHSTPNPAADLEQNPVPSPAQNLAQQLASEWQLDGEDLLLSPEVSVEPVPHPTTTSVTVSAAPVTPAPVEPLAPDPVSAPVVETPVAQAAPAPEPRRSDPPSPAAAAEHPPSLAQLVEAMLFVGGPPLSAKVLSSVVRAPEEQFPEVIETLNRRYQAQRRPYSIQVTNGGYLLSVRPAYRALTARLSGGPKSTRLSQVTLDVLSLVAYRQPISKADVDAMRGNDSGAILRQLVRLGLISSSKPDPEAGVTYSTTSRFLELFQLPSLDDLPRLGESSKAIE